MKRPTPGRRSEPVATSGTVADRASDILHAARAPLDAIFAPKSVAVVGATDRQGTVGRSVLWNLVTNPFGGVVFPVNPTRPSVLGIQAYPDMGSLPGPVDLAVVVTPAPTVPEVIRACAKRGVKGAIVISAGFKETGPAGVELERQVLAEARAGGMRLVGPNCLGVMNPQTGLNATFASAMARQGSIAFISQSGALCTAVLDWSLRANVGFSAFVSVGSMLDVGWGDLIDYLGDDPRTRSILLYMETVGDARAFLSAAREVAFTKPIIVLKPGRTAGAARAAASHTGALAGSDEVLEAAFRRSGVLRVDSIAELFSMADTLAKQPRAAGPRLAIVTNAGGPAVLAADELILSGGRLAELAESTIGALNDFLPAAWSHNNPVDVLGDADAERYDRALEAVAADPGTDGVLVILTPQAMTDPTAVAERLKRHARLPGKPLLAAWMGGAEIAAGEAVLTRAGVPTFLYPDAAARAFTYTWRYSHALQALYETPMLATDAETPRRDEAREVLAGARRAGRVLLTEAESKRVLAAYGVPTVATRVAHSADEAAHAAEALGFPVAVKLHSETVTHKTDVGGVRLDVADAAGVRRAYREIEAAVTAAAGGGGFLGVTVQPMVTRRGGYELIVGATVDEQFGPVLLFGAGGELVEVLRDRALALPPLTSTLARRLMERTRIFTALQGIRGRPPVDLAALEQLLVRVSELIVEQSCIKELDINPLLVSPEGLVALDARVVVYGADVPEDALPRPAIRPYPRRYVRTWRAPDGATLTIRPIRPEDEPLMARFHAALSERSVWLRYLHPITLDRRVAHERLARICFIDYDREMVFVAERPEDGERAIVGVARLTRLHWRDEAEFALLIRDESQRMGLGAELLRVLLDVARQERIARVVGFISSENHGMLRLAKKAGFSVRRRADDPSTIEVEISIV